MTMLTSCQSLCLKISQKVSIYNFASEAFSKSAVKDIFGAKIQIFEKVVNLIFAKKIVMRHF